MKKIALKRSKKEIKNLLKKIEDPKLMEDMNQGQINSGLAHKINQIIDYINEHGGDKKST
jgi:hypothetical protein